MQMMDMRYENHVIEIKDFLDPALDVYARLNEVQLLNRQDLSQGMFIAESPKVIERALDGGYEPVSFSGGGHPAGAGGAAAGGPVPRRAGVHGQCRHPSKPHRLSHDEEVSSAPCTESLCPPWSRCVPQLPGWRCWSMW